MSDKEKIIHVINNIDNMLSIDFITVPVREELNNIKSLLEEVRDNL